MSSVDGSDLDRYQGADSRRWPTSGCVVSVERVPEQQDAVAEQSEWDGALDGLGHTVAGLSDTEDVLDVEKGDFDAPSGRVASNDDLGWRREVGGDQRDAVTPGRIDVAGVVTDEDDPHGVGAPSSLPETDPLGDLHRSRSAVTGHHGPLPGCRGGDRGRSADLVAFQPWPAAFPGPGR